MKTKNLQIPTFLTLAISASLLLSCGSKEKKEDGFSVTRQKSETSITEPTVDNSVKPSERIDLENKGVGPITSLELPETIDETLVAQGEEAFKQLCLACHKVGKRFIGPAPNGILERRSPEWVMNMMLNPEVMVKEDPLAKELLMEFNGSPMANQGLSEEQARAILEYFRTLK